MLRLASYLVSLLAAGGAYLQLSRTDTQVIFDARPSSPGQVLQVEPDRLYSLSYSVDRLTALEGEELRLQLRDGRGLLLDKMLASGDGDLYVLFRARTPELRLEAEGAPEALSQSRLRVIAWPAGRGPEAQLESEPNNRWEDADSIRLEETVWAGGDDQPYLPLPGSSGTDPEQAGADWFVFEFAEAKPRLAFFWVELLDRDNIPVDVSVHRLDGPQLVPFQEGADPVTPPHEVQAMHGNKFTTRVLREPGRYYVRVVSHHPWYQLKTSLYPLPPYQDPRQAVQTAVDYLVSAGDSWHANTPRKGGVLDRLSNYHHETSLCVACHPTHFTLRAQLHAIQNGYPVRRRSQLAFLTERFYNNPLPLPGHHDERHLGASWTRVISAPANVLGRMAGMLKIFEEELDQDRRDRFFRGVGEYLRLYYQDRTELPPDETNGNRPLVSTFEVALYGWVVLDELHRRTGEAQYAAVRDRLPELVAKAEVKNMLDLCYQTLALLSMDRRQYQSLIDANCERILSYQRPSGQWAATFNPEDPEAEFQTGHCVWTLAAAGYPPEHPGVARSVEYLLKRQQEFGGWFDPLQSYENFRTPFRESQMAVLALSRLYPQQKQSATPPAALDFASTIGLLQGLDQIWDPVSEERLDEVIRAASHPDALVRTAALTVLGRTAQPRGLPTLLDGLGDRHKMVQRAAAWSLRQLFSRKGLGAAEMMSALRSPEDRVRWGALRIFNQHFSELAKHPGLGRALLPLLSDPVAPIRVQASQSLWKLWYWSGDQALRSQVEDALLAALAREEDRRVVQNLQDAVYILTDENIRYLYNNWLPLLARVEDRDAAVLARLAIEDRLAGKLISALELGDARLQQRLLAGLADFHLRSPAAYGTPVESPRSATLYTRIGNDIETVKFFGRSAARLAQTLSRLTASPNAEVRRLAAQVAFTVREDRIKIDYGATRQYGLADVVRLAGPTQPGTQELLRSLLDLLHSDDPQLRSAAGQVRSAFTLAWEPPEQGKVEALVTALLDSPHREARAAGWDLVARGGDRFKSSQGLRDQVGRSFVAQEPGEEALQAIGHFPDLLERRDIRLKIYRNLASGEAKILQGTVRLCLEQESLLSEPLVFRRFSSLLSDPDPEKQKALLGLAADEPRYLDDVRVVSLISAALRHEDPGVSGAALSLVQKHERLAGFPAVAEALAARPELSDRTRLQLPDYVFFRERVEPIFEAVGKDGKACVNCHQSHSILRLWPPPEGGTPESQLQDHYRSALRVVDLENPSDSLILRKPVSTAEAEGTLSSRPNAHGGGIRWSEDSEAYRTILDWIYTARAQ